MADLAVTNAFTNGTVADANQVDTNFNDITSWINANAIRKDATVAFTSIPSGPSSDPTTNQQFTRKKYVDDHDIKTQGVGFTGNTPSAALTQVAGSTITISDPGYDFDVWGAGVCLVSPATIGDLANLWDVQVTVDGVVVGSVITPVIQNTQSLPILCRPTRHTSGTDCVIRVYTQRINGAQTSLTIASSSNRSFFDALYRKH